MLFNSYHFILVFLPIILLVFYSIGRIGHHRVAITWIVAASFFFYGWWNPAYLGLMLGSILVNYAIGVALINHNNNALIQKKLILISGILLNLGLLGYFKYANFFIENINALSGSSINLEIIILPLAISFFTFQQITYLVDAHSEQTKEYNFLHYCLYVTFFPQLIAGPIVHHKEMLPQFAKDSIYRFNCQDFSVGVTIFIIGLFKKIIIADNIALYSTPVFDAAESGIIITFLDAWIGALAYTFQLYFDFSGYSDMAIGLARMFGIRLPLNFSSPYKANCIIDFWRRWHMTLSRFLRDYLYIPLGGSKKGNFRRFTNLFITMLLGGLWHGAGWTFIFWGGLHGLYLVINHAWRWFSKRLGLNIATLWYSTFARIVTFIAVVISWVFFRSTTLDSALNILKAMAGLNGIRLEQRWIDMLGIGVNQLENTPVTVGTLIVSNKYSIIMIMVLLFVVWVLPNTQQLLSRHMPALETYPNEIKPYKYTFMLWNPSTTWMLIIALMGIYSLWSITKISEFLYFQF